MSDLQSPNDRNSVSAEIEQFGPSVIITHLSARSRLFLPLVSPNDISIHQGE